MFQPFSIRSLEHLLTPAVQHKYLKLKTVVEHQPELGLQLLTKTLEQNRLLDMP